MKFALVSPGPAAPCSFPRCILDAFHEGDHEFAPKPTTQRGRTFHCVVCGAGIVVYGEAALAANYRTCGSQDCILHLARHDAPEVGIICPCRQRPYPHDLKVHELLRSESYSPKLRLRWPWSLALSARIEPSTEKIAAMLAIVMLLFAAAGAPAQDVPDAPSHSKAFLAASAGAAAITLLDSYGTSLIKSHAEKNSFGVKRSIDCLREGGEPFLYGREPSVARSWSVGTAKIAAGEALAVWLYRRHHHRLWMLPFAYEGVALTGAVRNLEECR